MYANTCWGLLGLAVTFGLAVIGLPTQYEWLAPWFTGAAVACGVGSVICFAWPLRQQDNRARMAMLIVHPVRAIRLIEPLHIVVLGLLIAAVGVAWQMRRPQSKPSDSERAAIIAPFQNQIDELRNQIASIPRLSGVGGYVSGKPEQSVERQLTTRTVRELRAFYEGRTRLQADAFIADEKGKLIEAEGTIVNVDSGMVMLQTSEAIHNGMPDYVECRFGPAWNSKLGTYRQSEHMRIRGVIGPSQNGAQIYLHDCEIIG